jgi:hypothetical protein
MGVMDITLMNIISGNSSLEALFDEAESKFPPRLRRDGWYLSTAVDPVYELWGNHC